MFWEEILTVPDEQTEEWRQIGESPAHEVSSFGRVRNRKTGILLRPRPARGYPMITLYAGGVYLHRKVHRLVLDAFVGPPPPGHQAAHRDGDRSNNRVGNLCWLTPADNCADKLRHGTNYKLKGSRRGLAFYLHAEGMNYSEIGREIGRELGVTGATISNMINGYPYRRKGVLR